MNKKFEAEYLLFAGRSRLIAMFLLLLGACGLTFLLSAAMWQFAVVVGPILGMAILSFMDYFAFSGFNSKKQIGMDLLKSSTRGRAIIERALKQDLLNKTVYMITIGVVTLVLTLLVNPEIEDLPFTILYVISSYASCQTLLHLVLLLDRAKGLTMQAHILICYLFYSVGSLILLPLIFLSENMSALLMGIYAAVAAAVAVFTGFLLIRSCMKAFDASLHDAPEMAA